MAKHYSNNDAIFLPKSSGSVTVGAANGTGCANGGEGPGGISPRCLYDAELEVLGMGHSGVYVRPTESWEVGRKALGCCRW